MNSSRSSNAVKLEVLRPGWIRAQSTSRLKAPVNLRTRGRQTLALNTVDLAVKQGEFVSIVGPSGCGKSTLMRLIAGLLPCSEGRVVVDVKTVNGPETNVSIVFRRQFFWNGVRSSIMCCCKSKLGAKAVEQYRQRAEELLAAVGLTIRIICR